MKEIELRLEKLTIRFLRFSAAIQRLGKNNNKKKNKKKKQTMIILNNCYLLATAMFRYLHSNEGDGIFDARILLTLHVLNLGRECAVTRLSEVPENYRNKYWLFFLFYQISVIPLIYGESDLGQHCLHRPICPKIQLL